MSLTPNPLPELDPLGPISEPAPPSTAENPSWTGWDVLSIAVLTIISIIFFLTLFTYTAQRLLYPYLPVIEVAKQPLLTVIAQVFAYLVILAFMVSVAGRTGDSFWTSVRWNWPQNLLPYLAAGVMLAFALQGVAHLVPMPKQLPIDLFFRTPAEAWALSVFGITFAPLFEELFFRGFLYPVLVRRLGIPFAIIVTSASFGLIHAPQLGRAWGPVLVVFLVGLALTITRAVTKSVGASLLIHIAYNFTLSALLYIATSGFHHLERLTQ